MFCALVFFIPILHLKLVSNRYVSDNIVAIPGDLQSPLSPASSEDLFEEKVRLLLLFCQPIFLCLHYCVIVLYIFFFYVECFWVLGLRKNSHSCMILCTSLGLTTCWIPVEACSVVSSVAAQNMRPWCYNKLSRLCFTLFYSSYTLTLSWTFSILSYLCHGVYQTWNL